MPGDRPPIEGAAAIVQGEGTLHATAEVLSLDREADREGLSVADAIALGDARLRRWVALRVVRAFIVANSVTLAALGVLVLLDEINIALHLIAPSERIVGSQVIMSLLGATTVQVGAIAVIIARYLFPGRQS